MEAKRGLDSLFSKKDVYHVKKVQRDFLLIKTRRQERRQSTETKFVPKKSKNLEYQRTVRR
jgi:hypothetical protein